MVSTSDGSMSSGQRDAVGSGVGVAVGWRVGVGVGSAGSLVGCLVGRATTVATALGVDWGASVGIKVGVLVGVGVGGGWLLHPKSDADATARTVTSNANSVTGTTPDGLCRALLIDLSNLSSSCWGRREDTAKLGICQNLS